MKLAAAIAGLAALNILLGFASNWYTLTAIGPGPETDALYAGMVVPNFLLAIFIGSFGSVMVPLLATEKTETINKEAWSFFQGIALLYCGLAALLWVSASWWGPLTAPGFDAAAKTSFISLIRTHLFSMVGNALTLVLVGVYHSRQKFLVLEVSAIISTTTGLGFLLWGLPRFGVIAAIWATAIKLFLQVLILIPGLGSYKTPDWGSRTFKEAFRRMRPLALGNAYSKTDQLVDTYLASLTPAGGLSLLHLARQIYSSGQLILDKAITNPAAPLLAQAASRGEWRSYSRISGNRTGWMLTRLPWSHIHGQTSAHSPIRSRTVRGIEFNLVVVSFNRLGGLLDGWSRRTDRSVEFLRQGKYDNSHKAPGDYFHLRHIFKTRGFLLMGSPWDRNRNFNLLFFSFGLASIHFDR